jgi:hypothetical protein
MPTLKLLPIFVQHFQSITAIVFLVPLQFSTQVQKKFSEEGRYKEVIEWHDPYPGQAQLFVQQLSGL